MVDEHGMPVLDEHGHLMLGPVEVTSASRTASCGSSACWVPDQDQLLGAVQEGRAGEDGGQDQARTEGGAGVHPVGRAQALGRGRWERRGCWSVRVDAPLEAGRRGHKMPVPGVADQGVISDTLAC
jgi:hypothetical protein